MQVDQKILFEDVLWLTSVIPARNFWNADILAEIAQELISRFHALGCSVQRQDFEADGDTYSNIIASIGPQDAERIIISAHYDVCGEIAGADVNASGIAGLLELAHLFHKTQTIPNKRIDFVAYCLTEAPFFGTELMGSAHHIAQLQQEKANVYCMLALSGIGYFTDEPNSQEYPILAMSVKHSTIGNFIGVSCLSEQAEWFRPLYLAFKKQAPIPVELINYPSNNDNVGMSDHRCFLRKGYRAAMIGNGGANRNPNYHQIPDTVETLDFGKMAIVIQALYAYLTGF